MIFPRPPRQQKKRKRARGKSLLVFVCAFAAAAGLCAARAETAQAGALEATTILSQRGEWDTNPLLLSGGQGETIMGSVTTPEVTIRDETPRSALEAHIKVEQKLYDNSDFNTTDVFAEGSYATRRARWMFRLPVSTTYDTTRTSEITTFGWGTAQSRHLLNATSPSLTYHLSERTLFRLEGNFDRSTYASDLYTDYHEESVTPSFEVGLRPDVTGFFSVKANRYQAEGGLKSRVDSIRPMTGLTVYLTKITTLDVSGGAEAAKQSYEALPFSRDDTWVWNGVYSASLTMAGEINKLKISATYERQPYADGTESLLSTYAGDWSHTFNAALTGSLGASYQKNDADQKTASYLDTQMMGNIGLSYELSKDLKLEARGTYKHQRLTSTGEIAKETVATLGLVLTPRAERLFK